MIDSTACRICRSSNPSILLDNLLLKDYQNRWFLSKSLCAEHLEQWTKARRGLRFSGVRHTKEQSETGRDIPPRPAPTFFDIESPEVSAYLCGGIVGGAILK